MPAAAPPSPYVVVPLMVADRNNDTQYVKAVLPIDYINHDKAAAWEWHSLEGDVFPAGFCPGARTPAECRAASLLARLGACWPPAPPHTVANAGYVFPAFP